MTEPGIGYRPMVAAPPDLHQVDPDVRQIRAAAVVFGALVVVGAILGPVWSAWSPPGPLGERIPAGIIADETEAFIAADGRFAVLTLAVGLLAAAVAWFLRAARGPWMVAALALGGLAGAGLTALVGHAVRGSSRAVPVAPHVERIAHLPLSLHATGLLFLECAAAALVYGLCVAFTAYDDLGRPDPMRRPRGSAQPGRETDDGGGHGDAPGALQQGEFPA